MSIFMVIISGLFAILLAYEAAASAVHNNLWSESFATFVVIVFVALYVAAIISRIRFRRKNPAQDAKEGRIMALVGATIVILVALSNLAKKNKR